jgi:hypothetical protein
MNVMTSPVVKGRVPRSTSVFRLAVSTAVATLMTAACLVGVPAPSAVASSTLGAWSVATPPSPTEGWSAVAFGDGQWVAVGHGADVAVSSDGSTWTNYPVPSGSWQTVTYGDGEFIALSTASQEMISSNGVSWRSVAGPSGPWTGLTYGEGRFVAVGSHGEIATSTDAVQWSVPWSHQNYDLTDVAYGNDQFVATDAAMGATIISSNGLVWHRLLPLRSGIKWGAVAFGNGNFVELDDSGSGYFATSVYGWTWTLHQFTPAQEINDAAFGCGAFVAAGQSTGSTNEFFSSSTGASWSGTPVPTDVSAEWTGVAYGAHTFVAVNSAGDIAWSSYRADCAGAIPSVPLQVSGNVHNGEVWTYMHPAAHAGGASVNSYRVNISDGGVTKQCSAAVYFQPNCIIRGLTNHKVYWVTTQAHNRFGYSVTTDPEFVIPVASWRFSAVTAEPVIPQSSPVVIQVTGVVANSQGIYPVTTVTVHFGSQVLHCTPNPFGECLITVPNPQVGSTAIYATYTGYGRSYVSATSHVTIEP